jgi:hypothetical protein
MSVSEAIMKHRLSFVAAVTLAAALSALAISAAPAQAGTCVPIDGTTSVVKLSK